MKHACKIEDIYKHLVDCGFMIRIAGDKSGSVVGFSSLIHYREGTFTWVNSEEKTIGVEWHNKALVIAQEGLDIGAKCVIYTNDSKRVFFELLNWYADADNVKSFVGKNTVISSHVKLGKVVYIGNNCSIVGDISIGDNTIISDNVVINNRVNIGFNCIIQSFVVIGEDGFSFVKDETGNKSMVRHYGGVTIGNEVFIGCHTNIARGTIDDTVIEDNVNIAPSTHIGHNCQLGKNCTIICSQLYGSVKVGQGTYVTSTTVRDQIEIGHNSIIGIGSIVTKNIGSNMIAFGSPAKEVRENTEKWS